VPDSQPDLRLQLLPLELIAHGATDTLRDAGGGLVSRLVRRSERGVVPVARDEAATLEGSEPFATAAEHTFRLELSDADVRDHETSGVTFRMIAIDGSPFVTAALFWPDTTANFPGMTDALVCAPRLSAVLVRPVLTQADIGTARTLSSIARLITGRAADPCTDGVFWWREGRFHRIDFDEDGSQPVLPTELGPVAATLPL